jgi:hypothetical protein
MDAQEPAGGPASEPERDDEPQGVFGNLPRTRPGARSPRRDTEGREDRVRPSVDSDERASRSGDPRPPAEEPDAGGGFEDVAWAGVAAAAEAATIGVRLANRALEAMRDAVDRR